MGKGSRSFGFLLFVVGAKNSLDLSTASGRVEGGLRGPKSNIGSCRFSIVVHLRV
jgi:hypothetical protein